MSVDAPLPGGVPEVEGNAEGTIQIRLREMDQLFFSIDPSPFREKDLDPAAEEFIVSWATDLPPRVPIRLVVFLDHAPPSGDPAALIQQAVRRFFRDRALYAERRHRQTVLRGWRSLGVGLLTLTLFLVLAQVIEHYGSGPVVEVIHEGLTIGGWVAIWKPFEVFRYDRWQLRDQWRIFDRLAHLTVVVRPGSDAPLQA